MIITCGEKVRGHYNIYFALKMDIADLPHCGQSYKNCCIIQTMSLCEYSKCKMKPPALCEDYLEGHGYSNRQICS